jgi:glycosyltransferase involved in cell wall biosynthesis
MGHDPLVSIIIPTYNRSYVIWETLDSVLDQTYTNWECIIVDDGGNDNTSEVVEKYIKKTHRFKYFKRPSNITKGVNSCRNYGTAVSKGEFIIFLDSDDILASYALFNRMEYFEKFPDNDFLVFTTQFFENEIVNKREVFNIDPIIKNKENYLLLFLNYQFAWQTMSPIWKKSTLLKKKFRNDLHLLEDVVFHIEILFLQDIKFKRINEIDTYYRVPNWGKNNNSESVDKMFDSISFLLRSYNSEIHKNRVLEKGFSRFVKVIYSTIIKSNNSTLEKKKMLSYLRGYRYISFKEVLLFKVYSTIYKFKLNNIKNIGMYQLIHYLNKSLFP